MLALPTATSFSPAISLAWRMALSTPSVTNVIAEPP